MGCIHMHVTFKALKSCQSQMPVFSESYLLTRITTLPTGSPLSSVSPGHYGQDEGLCVASRGVVPLIQGSKHKIKANLTSEFIISQLFGWSEEEGNHLKNPPKKQHYLLPDNHCLNIQIKKYELEQAATLV
ncbi:hypothetical protein AMATHDRAFT_47390 [Amanita thiersii Skay4041]|uniref:Uncharacterized protein n=1 Tax=Amanita thiersii Skay4041 TaxID=703135 RepID=A0A2A9NRU1_9AGAR|nr:hypothetical protein AMATHDRAFT_47390 [Amanita thiersii Skay4041]